MSKSLIALGCSAASSCQLGPQGVSAISSNLHDPGRHGKSRTVAGSAFSGRPWRLKMLVGYWKAFQWSLTGRVEIKLTILWL